MEHYLLTVRSNPEGILLIVVLWISIVPAITVFSEYRIKSAIVANGIFILIIIVFSQMCSHYSSPEPHHVITSVRSLGAGIKSAIMDDVITSATEIQDVEEYWSLLNSRNGRMTPRSPTQYGYRQAEVFTLPNAMGVMVVAPYGKTRGEYEAVIETLKQCQTPSEVEDILFRETWPGFLYKGSGAKGYYVPGGDQTSDKSRKGTFYMYWVEFED